MRAKKPDKVKLLLLLTCCEKNQSSSGTAVASCLDTPSCARNWRCPSIPNSLARWSLTWKNQTINTNLAVCDRNIWYMFPWHFATKTKNCHQFTRFCQSLCLKLQNLAMASVCLFISKLITFQLTDTEDMAHTQQKCLCTTGVLYSVGLDHLTATYHNDMHTGASTIFVRSKRAVHTFFFRELFWPKAQWSMISDVESVHICVSFSTCLPRLSR